MYGHHCPMHTAFVLRFSSVNEWLPLRDDIGSQDCKGAWMG